MCDHRWKVRRHEIIKYGKYLQDDVTVVTGITRTCGICGKSEYTSDFYRDGYEIVPVWQVI